MTSEQEKTIDALHKAIQMEIDGKDFYLKAAKESRSEAGKTFLAELAAEEEVHRQIFADIFDAITNKKGWPKVDWQGNQREDLKTLFREAVDKSTKELQNLSSEMKTVDLARQMETRTFDYYTKRGQQALERAEKEFYFLLAAQEQGHNLALAEYLEFLTNPAGFFVVKERPHLD